MHAALNDAKRRVVQTAAERLGKAERVGKDTGEMKVAQDNFRVLEASLKNLLDQVKAHEQLAAKFAQSSAQRRIFGFCCCSSGNNRTHFLSCDSLANVCHRAGGYP
jgi:hypothetical protein